jgi:hypothetical protein
MALTLPEDSSKKFELCPAGNHLAICYRVIDHGTQVGDYGPKRLVYIGWEIPEEKMDDGRPFSIGRRYTLSAHEKSTFRKHLEAWRNKAFTKEEFGQFHLSKLLGIGCMIQIVHTERDGNTYANVASVSSLPKGMQVPALVNQTQFFSLEADEFEEHAFNELSEKMQATIAASPEFAKVAGKSVGAPAAGDDDAEGVPF